MNLSKHAASVAVDSICSLLNGGSLKIYNAAGVLLAEPRFAKQAFKPSIDGLAESYPLIDDDNARASGQATSFKACDTSGGVIIFGNVGEDMEIDNPHIAAGARVDVRSLTLQFPGE